MILEGVSSTKLHPSLQLSIGLPSGSSSLHSRPHSHSHIHAHTLLPLASETSKLLLLLLLLHSLLVHHHLLLLLRLLLLLVVESHPLILVLVIAHLSLSLTLIQHVQSIIFGVVGGRLLHSHSSIHARSHTHHSPSIILLTRGRGRLLA